MGSIIQPIGGKLWTPTSGTPPIINYIGWNNVGATPYTRPAYCKANKNLPLVYGAVTGDVLVELGLYGKAYTSGDKTVTIGIYDCIPLPLAINNLVYSNTVIVPYVGPVWCTVSCSFALTNGTIYAVACDSGGGSYKVTMYASGTSPTYGVSEDYVSTLPATWSEDSQILMKYSLYGKVQR